MGLCTLKHPGLKCASNIDHYTYRAMYGIGNLSISLFWQMADYIFCVLQGLEKEHFWLCLVEKKLLSVCLRIPNGLNEILNFFA